ncbi:MAG: hypothetical protein JJLCMIEE_00683 [Acidimicrobiales bacterium]|nr:hypothetical protein [Acidimicrobiales bacterium]
MVHTTEAALDKAELAARYARIEPSNWGTDLPGLVKTVDAPAQALALTFDACGGPGGNGVDQDLIDLLTRENVACTLFLNQRWIDANPAIVDRMVANPLFEIANHGTRHVPLSVDGRSAYGIAGTGSPAEVIDEVFVNHERLVRITGLAPRWFRPGTAHYDDVALRIVTELDERPTGFAVNGDAGATAATSAITDALLDAPAGAIVLLHMNQPSGSTAEGLAAALATLRERGTRFVTLSGDGTD